MRRASLLLRLLGGLAALLAAAARGAVGCGVPTRLRFAELRNEYKNQNKFSVEETAKYTCRPGYRRDPQLQPAITCLENGSWSKALEFCKKKSCGHPGEPENGRVIVTDIHFGSTVNFTCEDGHRLIGQPYRRCEISGRQVEWTGAVPICERIPCLPPPDIPNGRHTGVIMEDFSYGSVVTYKCDNGYPLTGEASIHCTTKDGLNGEWSARPPRCGEVRCPAPQIQNGRRVSGDRHVYLYNDSVTFECDPGYTMKGHSVSQCQTDDTWDPPLPVCEPGKCQNSDFQALFYNGVGMRVLQMSKRFRKAIGLSVNYHCDPDYSLLGEASPHCTASGAWSNPHAQCEEVLCIAPAIQNGRKVAGHGPVYRPRDTVRFECDPGYTLNGSRQIQCQDDGNWDSPVPACTQVLLCPPPPVIVKGKHNGKPLAVFPRGAYVNYSCDPGYALRGEASIYCTTSGTWSHPSPLCEEGCGVPTRLSFAELKSEYKNQSSFPVGKTINYTCRPGYSRHPHMQSTVTCLENRTWSEAFEFCKKKSCGHPGEPENGRVIVTDIHFGSTVNFTCEEGHRLIGRPYRRCDISGMRVAWSDDVPICERIPCLPPPDIPNGSHTGKFTKNFSFGSAVTYKCENGYLLTGEASIHCTTKDGLNGVWSARPPRCGEVRCPAPQIQNGRRVSGDRHVYLYNDSVTFECDPGYTMKGHSVSQCQTDDTWDPPLPVCEPATCVSPEVENGRTNGVQPGHGPVYRPRDTVRFECDPGYTLNGSRQIQCRDEGTWDPPVPACTQVLLCPPPPVIVKGKHNGKPLAVFPSGAYVNYSCDPGYALRGEASIYCTTSGTWSHPSPLCEEGCGVPTRLSFAELKSEYKNQSSFPVGKTINYTCRPGYSRHPHMQSTVTCLENRTWSEAFEFCKKKSCGHPGEPENGRVIVTDIHFGSTVNFTCEEGHRLIGRPYRRCDISGMRVAWSDDVPICERIPCLPPPDIPNGSHTGKFTKNFSFGSAVTYKCENGYLLTGEASIHCTTKDGLNGVWSARPPRCGEVRCPAPQIQNGRRVSGDRHVYLYNDSVTFECDPGYTMKGHSLSQCQTDDTWDPPLPVCEPATCVSPGVENGRTNGVQPGHGPVYRPRDTVRFECDPGYTLNGSRQIQCRDEGTWDPPVPACTQVLLCPPPPVIVKGKHNGKPLAVFPSGAYVNYSCDPGYALRGEASIYCTTSGTWSHPSPLCEEVLCIAPEIQNGRKVAGRGPVYRPRDTVRFECDPGYTLNGSHQIQCRDEGTWDPPVPACTQATCVSPEVEHGRTNGVQPAYRPRDMVVFECDPGYTLSGSPRTQCQADGRWDPPVPVCERSVQCVSPPAIANGKPSGQALAVFTSGMSVNYSCEPGYSVTGQASIYCLASGTWSSPPPRCEEVLCIAPEIQNGRKVAGRGPIYRPRDTVRFECDPGYTLNGSRLIQCQDDGNWDPPVPACTQVLLCPPPPIIVKGKHNAKPLAAFPSGAYVNYSCEPGYALRGEASIYCTTSGTWSHPSPLCEEGCGVPTRLSFAELKSEYKNQSSFPVGKTINYTCRPGYSRHPHMQSTVTCLENRTWSEALKFCKKKSCGHPGEPENGRVIVTDIHFGSTVNFTCEEGHRLIGQPYRRCEISGMHVAWSGGDPICEQVRCPAPQIQNGRRVSGDRHVYLYNDSVTFECDPGYTMKGHSLSQCQTDDTWDPPLPVCEPATCVSPEVEHGRTNGVQRAYRPSDMVVFECDPGYTMSGSPETQCQADGRWDPPVPVCERLLQCSFPPAITNGKPSVQALAVFTTGTSVNYSCEPGYSLNGQASIYCAASGTWSPPPPQCEEILCIAPEIQNGRKVAGHGPVYRPRDTVRFECDPGYTLNASHQIQCRDDGTWDPPVPACTQVLLCPPPPVIVKGKHNGKPLAAFPSGAYVNYSCDPGYALRGEASIYCTTSGTWSHPSPLCEGSYNFISVVLGIAGGALLLLLVTIIISRIMSKQNAGYYYTHENCKYRMPLAHITEQKNSFAP
ncbi:complement receptor type 1 [Chelonia mydas]|uniref:complement receptor type 1 n=1 Tax=Chelonia mydas TaxID=8469 RepID=UPI001CA9FB0B|nr:complement receptor type 1 [Chelonia mydas]